MPVRKLSISVPPEVAETIKAAAAEEGKSVSTWVAEATARQAAEAVALAEGRQAARELIEEYEAEHGPIPVDSQRRVRQALTDLGLFGSDEQEPLRAAG